MRRYVIVILLAILLIQSSPSRAQSNDSVLVYGIAGSESGSYSAAMSHVEVQKLLLDLANAPRKAEAIDAALRGSNVSRAELEQLRLIRKQADDYVINFFLMTRADQIKVRQVTEERAKSLASAFLARREEIANAIQSYQVKGVDPKAVAYILIGCFVLDWDGLNVTSEKGYRAEAQTRPNGDRYTPWAREKSDLTFKGLFSGSHNEYEPEVVLTSFGDHFSVPRFALPDVIQRMPGRTLQNEMSIDLKRSLYRVVDRSAKMTNQRLGRITLLLRGGEKSASELAQASSLRAEETTELLVLLSELGYVKKEGERYHAIVPVFDERDKSMVQTVLRIGREVMSEWLAANYDQIKTELSSISGARAGVPYKEGFTEIWHYIFGAANRQMIEAGFLANPYDEQRPFKGFIPAVWRPSLNPDALGRAPG